MSNRVDELESRVAELQAAVDGLTEELVETRERLRALESDADETAGRPRSETVTPGAAEDRTNGSAEEPDHDPEPDPGTGAEADADADGSADAETDEGSSSDSDDIIVA
ncbi:MAG: hypothetical protein ABEJ81_04220 [Haloferacaceae archaeon]